MKRRIAQIILTLQLIVGLAVPALSVVPVHAAVDVFQGCNGAGGGAAGGAAGGSSGGSGSTVCGAAGQDDFTNLMHNIINTILLVLGMIAVIMIVIGGIRYTTSNGDSGNIQSAKNTILYAVIGLVVAILAYAIVNFVINALKK